MLIKLLLELDLVLLLLLLLLLLLISLLLLLNLILLLIEHLELLSGGEIVENIRRDGRCGEGELSMPQFSKVRE